MLTKLRIRNFKQFEDVEIELGQSVVFVGPNNSGKTTALQALALWFTGFSEKEIWFAEHLLIPQSSNTADLGETEITINRLELTSIPVPNTNLLWRNLRIGNGEPNIIEVTVEGIDNGKIWTHSLRFRYANDESIYCEVGDITNQLLEVAPSMAFLPSMSGIAATEPRIDLGRINVLAGEGRTAEILRNLCLLVYDNDRKTGYWHKVVQQMNTMFGVEILPPNYVTGRGEIRMAYKNRNGVTLDLSSSGRGMLQILLLLVYMYNNPGDVLLLDEPDAHLEILRQHEVYNLLTAVGNETNSQIIIASHSEAIMDKAFGRDLLISFAGKPKRVNTSSAKSQLAKSLRYISADKYYQADTKGWCLYLEGETDLAILQAFAVLLTHEAAEYLQSPFADYVGNVPSNAREPFFGLHHYKPDLVGIAIFDRSPQEQLQTGSPLREMDWRRYEIENYLCMPETFLAYARSGVTNTSEADQHEQIMQQVIEEISNAYILLGEPNLWSPDRHVSEQGLPAVFDNFYKQLGLPNLMSKTNYHRLVPFVPIDKIDPEITEKLDAIVEVARRAQPRKD